MELNYETLKKYRLRKNLSQDEVYEKTGIDITLLESGFSNGIKLSQLNKLVELYECCDILDFYIEEMKPEIKTHILYNKRRINELHKTRTM